jgi:hypothetical protein
VSRRKGKAAFDSPRQQRFMFAKHKGIAKKMVSRARHAGKGLYPGKRIKKKK